ncbi:MAG: M14 family zinc carboxypeptidase, partial [Candidatus Thorarchaeota archaeon]
MPSPFPDGEIPPLNNSDGFIPELIDQKESEIVPWIWAQYMNAPGPIAGDDVLHWGPNLGLYHNYSEVITHLTARINAFPEYLSMFTIGVSYQGLAIPCISLTAPGDSSNRQGFLIIAHHHGREAITIENALFILDYMLAHAESPGVQTILENFIIHIIPTLNPDALGVLHINPWQRKNLHPTDEDNDGLSDEWEVQDMNGDFVVERYGEDYDYTFEGLDLDNDGLIGEDLPGGIDLNRNYPVAFAQGASGPRSEVYHGSTPFSENETQAVQTFIHMYQENLAFAISLHSGVEVLLTPYGFTSEPSFHEPFFARLGTVVEEASGYPWRSATQLYPSFGTFEDWLYETYGLFSVTLETYGNESAYGDSIWDYFNPSTDQVMMVCDRVRNAFFAITDVLLDEPSSPVILVPRIVPSGFSTLVTVFIEESKSGFELLHLEYLYGPSN